jgi:hypothetical protein
LHRTVDGDNGTVALLWEKLKNKKTTWRSWRGSKKAVKNLIFTAFCML